jgi:hypothetical protein
VDVNKSEGYMISDSFPLFNQITPQFKKRKTTKEARKPSTSQRHTQQIHHHAQSNLNKQLISKRKNIIPRCIHFILTSTSQMEQGRRRRDQGTGEWGEYVLRFPAGFCGGSGCAFSADCSSCPCGRRGNHALPIISKV